MLCKTCNAFIFTNEPGDGCPICNSTRWTSKAAKRHQLQTTKPASKTREDRGQHLEAMRTTRREICHACEHYLPDENGCGALPEGRRNIDGAKGIPNPHARCPRGHWSEFTG